MSLGRYAEACFRLWDICRCTPQPEPLVKRTPFPFHILVFLLPVITRSS